MKNAKITWPGNKSSTCLPGIGWIKAASEANIDISTGCLGGSCGACEIEVNGEVIRACISLVPNESEIVVEFLNDPYW